MGVPLQWHCHGHVAVVLWGHGFAKEWRCCSGVVEVMLQWCYHGHVAVVLWRHGFAEGWWHYSGVVVVGGGVAVTLWGWHYSGIAGDMAS